MNTTLILIGASIFALVLNAFTEWFVHGPVMHGKLATEFLRKGHQDHHNHFKDGDYKNTDHGLHVHLPWWSMVIMVGFETLVGWAIAKFTGYQEIFWCVAIVSVAYYYAYQYVHTLMHIPITNWFDKLIVNTRVFQRLNAHHTVHHLSTMNNPWGKLVNIGLLCTLADHVMGTKFKKKI
jgi:hypothetical protein